MHNAIFERMFRHSPVYNIDMIPRRFLKLFEEGGEASQAFLQVTSSENAKEMTWEDFREELVDVMVVLSSIMTIRLPIDDGKDDEDIEDEIMYLFEKKIAKWQKAIEKANESQK